MNYIQHIASFSPLVGYGVVLAIIFAESGLLLGFFLPGDTLLFSLGVIASQGHFNFYLLILLSSLAAILGDSCGYFIGKKFGPAVFKRDDSVLFSHANVEKAHAFFERYGKLTIILARFTPVVRTFAPTMAGVAEMPYPIFLAYNIIGGTAWATAMLVAGHFLGQKIPNIDHYLLPIVVLVILVSALSPALHLAQAKMKKNKNV